MNVIPLSTASAPSLPRLFLLAVRQRWLKIAAFVLGVAGATVGLALISTPWYTAETTLLPPTEGGSDAFSNIAGLIESSALERVGLFSTQTPSDIYVEILESRRLRLALAQKYDLKRRYRVKTMTSALKELDRHLSVNAEPTGVIVLSIEDPRKNQVAEMASFMIEELDRFNRETLNTRGKRTRQFLEARLREVEQRMRSAEVAMTAYEKQHKVVLSTDDAAVRGFADVMGRKLSLQVQRAYMESYSAPGSESVRQVEAEIAAFDRELATLPTVKNDGARLALETQIQRKMFSYLTVQYESARVEELRDTPTVSVLDPPMTPEYKSRPKRAIMVLSAGFFATLLALGWVAFSVYRQARA